MNSTSTFCCAFCCFISMKNRVELFDDAVSRSLMPAAPQLPLMFALFECRCCCCDELIDCCNCRVFVSQCDCVAL